MDFFTQLVSALQFVGAGTPPPRRGRGVRGGVCGTRGNAGRVPPRTAHTYQQPDEDNEPVRERSASRGRGRGRSTGARPEFRAQDNRTSSNYDEQPQRKPTSGRGRRRGRGAHANTGIQADNRPPVSEVFDGSRTFQPIPDTLLPQPSRHNDYVHYNLQSAEKLVKFTLSRFQALN